MDWVHCNTCLVQPGDEELKKFFISNCGHIYCNDCLQTDMGKDCRICHVRFTTIPLSPNMSSDVAIYFHDPIVSLKKQIKVLEFQQSQRIRLVSHNRDTIKNLNKIKKENCNLKEELSLFKQENTTLRNEIKRLTDLLQSKNCETEMNSYFRNPQNTLGTDSFGQFLSKEIQRSTPAIEKNLYCRREKILGGGASVTSKPPSMSNYFVMSDSASAKRGNCAFALSDLHKFSSGSRRNKIATPFTNSSQTPDSIFEELSQRNPLQRKVKLPGSKTNSNSKIGLYGLPATRPPSATNKYSSITNKYLKYLK